MTQKLDNNKQPNFKNEQKKIKRQFAKEYIYKWMADRDIKGCLTY